LQRALDEPTNKVKVQASVTTKTRISADQNVTYTDQMAEYADANRDAANMRHCVTEKVEANLQ